MRSVPLTDLRLEDRPLALARLHAAHAVGDEVEVDIAPERVRWLFEGAGFRVDDARRGRVRATRLRSLPDIVGPGMRLLVCGLNPSLYAADAGVAFARPGNRFWPAALAAGLVTRVRDPWHALAHDGVGFTDLVKRATVGAASLTGDEYAAGEARVRWLVTLLRPAVVCVVGLTGWRAAVDRGAVAGPQPTGIDGAPVYLMPNTSGLNAHATVADFTAHFEAALLMGSRG